MSRATPMKTRIAYKFGLLASMLVAVAAYYVGERAHDISTNLLKEHEKVDLADEMKLRGKELLEQVAQLREDVLTLAGSPNVQGIVRRRAGAGSDGEPTEEDLVRAFQDECRRICWLPAKEASESKAESGKPKPYLRVRLIGADDGGRELVHVHRLVEEQDGQRVTRFQELTRQELSTSGKYQQAGPDYLTRAMQPGQPAQVVMLTPVGPSEEATDDEAGGDEERVLRAMVRLNTPADEFFGIVVIDLDFRELRKRLVSSRHLTYLTDSAGQFLIHPDPQREFAFAGPSGSAPGGRIQDEPGLGPQVKDDYEGLKADRLEAVERGVPLPSMLKPEAEFGQRFVMRRLKRRRGSAELAADVVKALKTELASLKSEYGDLKNRLIVQEPEFIAPTLDGLVISAPHSSPSRLADLDDAEQRLIKAGGRIFEREYDADCSTFHASFIRLPYDLHEPGHWLGLLMAFSQEELDKDVEVATSSVNWLIGLSIVGATAMAFLFSYMLTRRLAQVTRAAENIAAGQFNVDLPLTSRDEIGELARGFQHMIGMVRARETDLEVREARLQAVVGGAAEGIIQLKPDGEVREANAAALRIFRRTETDMFGRSFCELLAPQERTRFNDALRRLIKVGGTTETSLPVFDPAAASTATGRRDFAPEKSSFECVGLKADGREFPLEISLSLVRLPGEPIVTLIARDITHSKRAKLIEEQKLELERANHELQLAHEKAQELNKAKNAFLASVSHELRNPLNQVSGFCQLLEFSDLDDEQRTDIKKIRLANDQLLSLVNDILDYQKIVMGGVTLEPADFAVQELMNEICDAMSVQANENNNQLEFDCAPDAGQLFADKQRVRQVLLNLVGNACKFTTAGKVSVTARRRGPDDDQWIEFAVRDTGRGMSPEEQSMLFRPFAKLSSRQGNKSGTGLGLVISRGFCEMMHGDIQVKSAVGVGTTFTVRLPARETDHVPGQQPSPPATPADANATRTAATTAALRSAMTAPADGDSESSTGSGRLVLVIDDDPSVLEMMQRHLSSHGFQVATATTGIEGLELARKLQPAVITLDAIMPDLDGWSVLGALKAGEETADIPVVMVTVMDRPDRGYSLGATEFIAKPIDWDKLTATLSEFTGNKRDRSLLIVDDDAITREILRRQLSADGWSILEAENGEEALALLAEERPAAIILDLMMPVMDGFEFIVNYSQIAEWLSIPVLVLTAKDPSPDERRLLEGQVVRVLRKGAYNDQELLAEIHRRVDAHLREQPLATGEREDNGEDTGR